MGSLILISVMILTGQQADSSALALWKTFTSQTYGISFAYPPNGKVAIGWPGTPDSVLVVEVPSADTASRSNRQTDYLVRIWIKLTKNDFVQAATDWQFVKSDSNWYIYSDASEEDSAKVAVINDDHFVGLRGYQTIGQWFVVPGFVPLWDQPIEFLYFPGGGNGNITLFARYDPVGSDILNHIIHSVKVIAK